MLTKPPFFPLKILIFSMVLTETHEILHAQSHRQDFGLITVHGFNGFSFLVRLILLRTPTCHYLEKQWINTWLHIWSHQRLDVCMDEFFSIFTSLSRASSPILGI
jgi:hypothetical protein